MSFLFPSLLSWPMLLIVGIPILIHLIHTFRHQRVKWAAMDFLRESQRRFRKSIIFKKLLLLLVRITALAAILLMLAQPILRSRWGALVGGNRVHHVVLMDDSFSMSDRGERESAYDQAKQFVQRLVAHASEQQGTHRLTLLRFSRAPEGAAVSPFDVLAEDVTTELRSQLEEMLGALAPSQTAAGPQEALDAALRLPPKAADEQRRIYLVSDFRHYPWDQADMLKRSLAELHEAGGQIHLVHCADALHGNLAITELGPASGTRAAGVEMIVQVAVTNFGEVPVSDLAVSLQEDGYTRPGLVLERIEPGKTVARSFRVEFPTAGPHRIAASIPGDAVAADNARYCALDLPDSVPVLLVDSTPQARDAYFVAAALDPGGKVGTGLKPRVEPPSYLRRHDELSQYAAIYLLNLDRLDASEIEALETYVRSGGGLGFFLGERSGAAFFNEHLYHDGKGMFPAPLTMPTDLAVDSVQQSPDLMVSNHPIFAVLAGERNSFLNAVIVERYYAVPHDWQPSHEATAHVLAHLRNGAPFVIERQFGKGRVVAFLSKASPEETSLGTWNNWGRNNPSFVVTMLELQGYLSQRHGAERLRLVGEPLTVRLDAERHESKVHFNMPARNETRKITVEVDATQRPPEAVLTETGSSGFYHAEWLEADGSRANRIYAYNVFAGEGDLRMLTPQQLSARLAGVPHTVDRALELRQDSADLAGHNLSDAVLVLLVALLVGEQLLAYAASYHAKSGNNAK